MHERYRMYKRKGGVFYAKDRKTGSASALLPMTSLRPSAC